MKVIPVNVKTSVVNKVKNSSETLAKKTNKIISRDLGKVTYNGGCI